MTPTEKYGITKFDEQNYTQIVVDFIFNNPGCTAADILKKEEKKKEKREIGRKRLFAILRKLKRKKVIIEKKKHKNARNIMLYVREDNPIYIVSKELREFENRYPSLLKKVKEELESGKRLQKPEYFQYPEEFRLLDSTLLLFEIIRIFMLRSLMIWPRIIQDKYTRERLNFTIFSKLYQMQIKMSETL
jgi:hypothetical protein